MSPTLALWLSKGGLNVFLILARFVNVHKGFQFEKNLQISHAEKVLKFRLQIFERRFYESEESQHLGSEILTKFRLQEV